MWKEQEVRIYGEILDGQLVKNVGEQMEFLDYTDSWAKLNEMHRKYPGQDIFDASAEDKKKWNELSTSVSAYEMKVENTPIFDEMRRRYEEEGDLPEFLTGGKAVTIDVAGWYQNLRGDLYHYNGTVWDKGVPGRTEELEFLGGK